MQPLLKFALELAPVSPSHKAQAMAALHRTWDAQLRRGSDFYGTPDPKHFSFCS